MSNQQYRGAQIPDHRSDWLKARPPAPVWTSALSCPSSGNARLLPVYAGALSATASKLVYRKAKAGEHSYAKGTRWETLTGAAYVDQDTLNAAGTNVTAVGNTTHLGLSCNYITWPAATHDFASSVCFDSHGISIVIGARTFARIGLALSRNLTGDESIMVLITGASVQSSRVFNAEYLQSGRFYQVIVNEGVTDSAGIGDVSLYFCASGTLGSPLTIYVRDRMLFDATGLDASECVPDFVDPAVDYGFGAVGVKWVPTKCGNTVAANGVIIPGTGAALPEPMGVQWQPAATNLATYSPPVDTMPGITYLTSTDAPTAVAGLPAKRLTASTANNYIHAITLSLGAPFTGQVSTSLVFKKSANARPHSFVHTDSWYTYCYPSDDYSTVVVGSSLHGEAASLTPLGNDCYEMKLSANITGEVNPYFYLRFAKDDNMEVYVANGELLDIAALTICTQAYAGTPMLASGGATSRLADDPATGLPAIGTGPFTAFIDIMIEQIPPTPVYTRLFCGDGDPRLALLLYMQPSDGSIYFYKSDALSVSGACAVVAGARSKFAFRRKADGELSLFKDGVLEASIAATPYDLTYSPMFGSGITGYQCDMVIHDQWLDYSALSDEDCIRVTRI